MFPSADVLPGSPLKFYVQFLAPMNRGRMYEQVHVRDAAGRVIELPFLELGEELWHPAMTPLTHLTDSVRIRCGVKPLIEIGPVFEAGKAYSLTPGRRAATPKTGRCARPSRRVFASFRRIASDPIPHAGRLPPPRPKTAPRSSPRWASRWITRSRGGWFA